MGVLWLGLLYCGYCMELSMIPFFLVCVCVNSHWIPVVLKPNLAAPAFLTLPAPLHLQASGDNGQSHGQMSRRGCSCCYFGWLRWYIDVMCIYVCILLIYIYILYNVYTVCRYIYILYINMYNIYIYMDPMPHTSNMKSFDKRQPRLDRPNAVLEKWMHQCECHRKI